MSGPTGGALKSTDAPLVSLYDCAMLDLDGVVYVGEGAVDGAPELLSRVREQGMTLAFVTNNAARTPAAVATHLTELGVYAQPGDVVTSAQAAAREVASLVDAGAKVLVVGGEGLQVALGEHDLVPVSSAEEQPAAVVQGFHPTVGWALLAEGVYAIRAGAVWVVSNLDLTVPTARGIAPGNGTLVRAIEAAVGRGPDVVAGKPYRPLFDETVLRIASQRPLVVGDRLDTDIEGAITCGADSLLVMTGVTDLPALCRAVPQQRPSYVAWTLDALMRAHRVPKTDDDGGWMLDGWAAHVDGGRLDITQHGTGDEGLAVIASACWAWVDEQSDGDDALERLDLSGLEDLPDTR